MKVYITKALFALGIALVIGFLCEIIAPEVGGRNWISFAVAFVSLFFMLFAALGVRYENARRGTNAKVVAWLFALALLVANIVFSCFEYKIDIYIVACLVLILLGCLILYSIIKANE